MDNREAVNWLINILADIGKVEHSDLWHYEQALTEIKDMESAQLSQKGTTSNVISRQAAIDAVERIRSVDTYADLEYAKDIFRNIPPAQPEQRTGYFIGTEFDGYADGNPVYYEWECSECGCVFEDDEPTYNYCPNCGAKMEDNG